MSTSMFDDTRLERHPQHRGDLEFPLPFGRNLTDAEEYVNTLDEQTGASLKLTVLNPQGSVPTLIVVCQP